MTIFGPIHTDDQVEDAVLATLQKWLPTYMSEVERQLGLTVGYYQRPFESSYTARTDYEAWPEEMMPVVSVEGLVIEDDPRRDGRGMMSGKFAMGVTNTCVSNDSVYVRRYAARMGAAIRVAVMQHQSLDSALNGDILGIHYVGSRNNLLSSQDQRTIRGYRQLFVVEARNLLTRGVGPVAPDAVPPIDPTAPLPEWPTVPDRQHIIIGEDIQ